ncbi:MAG: glycoside hydrolase [Thaumarchaeota archaeon]|nr:glycoside hydrolase [Nitrososphaerota archaeon]
MLEIKSQHVMNLQKLFGVSEMEMKALSISLLTLMVISSMAFVVQASGSSFSTPVNLGPGFDPNVQSVGNHVYVAWTDKSGGIFFRASSDGGQSWGNTLRVGSGGQYPIMSASGNQVYMVWASAGLNFVNSSDNGATWSKPHKLVSNGITPFIASKGALVSVVYLGGSGGSYVMSSSNSGGTWTTPFEYSNGPEPQIAMSGTNIYVSADALDRSHIQFAVSHDSGKTWKINALEGGSESWVVATGSNVYAVWETKGTNSVVWFMSSSNNGDKLATKIISTGIPDAWNPMINAMGNSVWVGIQAFGAKTQNWMLTSMDGGVTFTSKSLTGLGHTDGFIFNIATTDGINVFAMWVQASSSTSIVLAAYSPDGGSTWSVVNVGQSDPNNDVAIGSISSNGAHGLAAWQNSSAIWFSNS